MLMLALNKQLKEKMSTTKRVPPVVQCDSDWYVPPAKQQRSSLTSDKLATVVKDQCVNSIAVPAAVIEVQSSSNAEAATVKIQSSDNMEVAANTTVEFQSVLSPAGGHKKRIRTSKQKAQRNLCKYKMLPVCQCRRKPSCASKICENRRAAIHTAFWKMNYNLRKAWIFSQVKLIPVARRRNNVSGDVSRNSTRSYTLTDESGSEQTVCKLFFLHTLGYKNDKVITVTMSSAALGRVAVSPDKRGRHAPPHKMSPEVRERIVQHVESYRPCVSHYRREHAPNRRYLPSEISIKSMYDDFKSTHSLDKCSYETYCKIVAELGISFTKLGEEQCDVCLLHDLHLPCKDAQACEACAEWQQHIDNAKTARGLYQSDAAREQQDECAIISTDMQKVMLLPRMPGIKTCAFTQRVVVFHQTFAPLEKQKSQPVIAVVWHEGISGRNAEDVASAYIAAIDSYRDCRDIIIWADNCSGQNKNWSLYTCLTTRVNQTDTLDSVTIRYLEKGHTFMAADSFHSRVEASLKHTPSLFDITDLCNVIEHASKNVRVKPMLFSDFRKWENGLSSGKSVANKPMLNTVREVRFERGSTHLLYKTDFNQTEYQSCNFLKKKLQASVIKKRLPVARAKPRGVPTKKVTDIVTKLCNMMPANRRDFWFNYPTDDKVVDLAAGYE